MGLVRFFDAGVDPRVDGVLRPALVRNRRRWLLRERAVGPPGSVGFHTVVLEGVLRRIG